MTKKRCITMPSLEEIAQEFWPRVQICAHGTRCRRCCWFFHPRRTVYIRLPGSRYPTRKGYPPSRMAWELRHGLLLSRLIYVCHTCDQGPWCCQDAHLFLGTPGDNARDMHRKGRFHGGAKKR
jgi:hypothetical protein